MNIFQEDRLVARLLSLLSPGLRRQDRTRKHQEKPLIEVVEDTGHSVYLQDKLHKNQDVEEHNQNHFQISQDKVWKSERWLSKYQFDRKKHCETELSLFWIRGFLRLCFEQHLLVTFQDFQNMWKNIKNCWWLTETLFIFSMHNNKTKHVTITYS